MNLYGNMPNLDGALCAQMDGDLFYDDYIAYDFKTEYGNYVSTAPKQHAQLRQTCLKCPVVQECREYAITHELYGFWGGMTAMERQSERVMRGIKVDEPRDYYMVKKVMGIKRGMDNGRSANER